MITLTPTESDIFATLRGFLIGILPSGGAVFTAKIDGTTLTIGEMYDGTEGSVAAGDALLGLNVTPNTFIVEQLTGSQGCGSGATYTIAPSQNVPSTMMSTGIEVSQAQLNRVSEPRQADFAIMTIVRQDRLATNIDTDVDTVFTGAISGAELTVTDLLSGDIRLGAFIYGEGVAPGTRVVSIGSPGLFGVSPSQDAPSVPMAAGYIDITKPAMVSIQVDAHGPTGADATTIIDTMFRSSQGVEIFTGLNPAITPLFNETPRQMPFLNGENQYEDRWIIELHMQVDYRVTVTQQYADAVDVDVVSVEATYPVS